MATFRTLKSGSINVQVRTKETQASKTFKTREEAELWALKIEATGDAVEQPTLVNIQQSYLKTMEGKPSLTILTIRYNNLIKFMGNKPLRALTSLDVYAYIDHRSKSIKGSTIRLEVQLLSRVLKHCNKRLLLDLPNIMDKVDLPEEGKPRDRVIKPNELTAITNNLSPVMSNIVLVAYYTAMRRSEVVNIRPCDVQLSKRQLWVRPDIAKNGEGRFVPLSLDAIEVLGRCIQGKATNTRIFAVEPHSVTTAFSRACKRLNIRGLVFHSLRHSAVTRYAEKGLTTMQLQTVPLWQDSCHC